MIAKGAEVNARPRNGWTALHEAARCGDEGLTELLLASGADVNATNDDGHSPLDIAERNDHTNISAMLEGYPTGRQAAL